MFRFTIREIVWLTVIVALGLGWSLERWRNQRLQTSQFALESEAVVSRMAIASLHQDIERIEKDLPPHGLRLVWSQELRPTVEKLTTATP